MADQVTDPTTGQEVTIDVVDGGPNDPFVPKNQEGTSEGASQGAPQEPTGSQPEGIVQPNPAVTAAPEPQVTEPKVTAVGPPPDPVSQVQVQPAQAPASTAPPAVAPAPTSSPEDLAPLAAWMQEQQTSTQEALRQQQSTYDKRAATLEGQIESSTTQMRGLTDQVRELGMRDLTPEEQQQARDRFAQEDKTKELEGWQKELTGFHDDLNAQSILVDYSQYGVTTEMLQGCESPEEMEILARDQQIAFLTQTGAPVTAGVTQPATTPVEPAQVTPVASQPVQAVIPEAPVAQVPAGATAPVDMGAGGQAPAQKTFNEEPSSQAMEENLKNMGLETVQLPN